MLRKLLGLALFVIGAMLIPAQVQYAKKVTDIHAGVLLINSWQVYDASNVYSYPENGAPFVWYNLESLRAAKPADWSFSNPHGSTVITHQINLEWTALQAANGGNLADVPAEDSGTILGKNSAPYWEVLLDGTSETDLADYDILSMSIRGPMSLNANEREKLRAYIDQGGVLWVDLAAATQLDVVNGAPVAVGMSSGPGSFLADTKHPILNTPNEVTLQQVAKALTDTSCITPANLSSAGAGTLANILETIEPDFNNLADVVHDSSSNSVISVAKIGSGYIVLTAGGIGDTLNRGISGGTNNHFYADKPALDSKSIAAGSIIANAVALNSSYSEPFTGSRKTNAQTVDLHAPLLRQFYASLPLSPGNRNFVPPATFKGLFIVSANDRIYVYDGTPGNDLNGDGNPDDGVVDSDLSSGLDLLWVSAAMPGPISSPTCVTVANPSGSATANQILVVDSAGTVHSFDPFEFLTNTSLDLNNVPEKYSVVPPGGAADFDLSADGRGPYAPTIDEGLAYIGDTQTGPTSRVGRMWVMNPATGAQVTSSNPWMLGGPSSIDIMELSGPPTVGYIPIQDNSGGQDLVAYLPIRPDSTGVTLQPAQLVSLWLGAKGERPNDVQASGSTLVVRTRANLSGLKIYVGAGSDPLGIKVSVIRASTGIPLTAAQLSALFDGSVSQGPDGILTFGLSGSWDSDYSMRIDYRIDLGSGALALTTQVRRGVLTFPDAGRTRRILGGVAMGPGGNIYVSLSDQARGGSFYAFKEDGRGLFRMLYRYELYDQFSMTLLSATPVTVRETFINEDPITTNLGADFQGPFTDLTLQSPPAIHGGLVFATATANVGPSNLPETVLMAFKANPEPVKIPVGNITDTFSVVQPDIAASVNLGTPEQTIIAQSGQFTYEEPGQNGYITFDNLMAARTGRISNALSQSQPIIIREQGVPDKVIEPDQVGGTWSPLVWYSVLEGQSTQSPPMITGNTVFVSGNSKLPDLLNGATPATATDRGVMFAIDADLQPLAPIAFPNSVRPWMTQVPMITNSGSGVQGNDVIRWPQSNGVKTFADWETRFFQTTLRPGDTSFGVAAGDGALFTWGSSSVYGFTRGDLLIADEGRLLRLDGAGSPLWSSDASLGSGSDAQDTTTTTVRTLVHPTRAYRLGSDQIVAVDPASNRVVRLNVAGREIRSITDFKLDPTEGVHNGFRPDGYVAGSPLKLNGPSDIVTFSDFVDSTANPFADPSALEYWVHYVIADSGNSRIIEIVDRYAADPTTRQVFDPIVDLSGNKQLGILKWHSPSNYSGKQFHYNSVARVFNPSTSNFTYAGGIGNATPTSTDLGLTQTTSTSEREASTGNGGIVLFNGSQTYAVSSFTMPAIGADVFYNNTSNTFSSTATPQRTKMIGNVNSVTMRYVTVGAESRLAIMFTNASGVYEIYQPTVGADQPWVCRWALPNQMYSAMRRDSSNVATGENPRSMLAMFARRLDSGEVIVANSYLGKTRALTPFTGEVVLLNGDMDPSVNNSLPGFDFGKQNFGFSSLSVRLAVSTLTDLRSITAPVFADFK